MEVDDGPIYDPRSHSPGKSDWEITEIYAYGTNLRSLQSIVGLSSFVNLQVLSLHGNQIERIRGLEAVPCLKELNISSNNIVIMEGLSHLSRLRVLNLASNRIKEITGLYGLFSLSKLVLSHNFIASLGGLSALHGNRYSLQHLDLRDNLITSVTELWVLAGCVHLEELILLQGKHSNPVCQEKTYKSTVTAALSQLKYLDGKSLSLKLTDGLYNRQIRSNNIYDQPDEQDLLLHLSASKNPVRTCDFQLYEPSKFVGPPRHHFQAGFTQQDCTHENHHLLPNTMLDWYPAQPQSVVSPCLSYPGWRHETGCSTMLQGQRNNSRPCRPDGPQHVYVHAPGASADKEQLKPLDDSIFPDGRQIPCHDESHFTRVSAPHIDHALKGFHRKRKTQGTSAEANEVRLELLESRVLDLVKNLRTTKIQDKVVPDKLVICSPLSDDESPDYYYNHCRLRNNADAKKRFRMSGRKECSSFYEGEATIQAVDAPLPKDSSTQTAANADQSLEHICTEVSNLQEELAKLKEQVVENNLSCNIETLDSSSKGKCGDQLDNASGSAPDHSSIVLDGSECVAKESAAALQKSQEPANAHGKSLTAINLREKIKVKLTSVQAETNSLRQALEAANHLRQDAENKLMNIFSEKEDLQKSTNALAKDLKDEHSRLLSCKKELEACKFKEMEAQEELTRLSKLIASERAQHKRELQQSNVIHEEQMQVVIAREFAAGELQGKTCAERELCAFQEQLQHTLEKIQQAIDEHSRSTKHVQSMQEKLQLEAHELRNAVDLLSKKEHDAEVFIKELKMVVNNQEAKLETANSELVQMSMLEEENKKLLQEMGMLRQNASKTVSWEKEFGNLQKQLEENYKLLQNEQEYTNAMKAQLDSLKVENQDLCLQVRMSKEKLQESEDVVRIKTKMLDSQNDTIKDLKLELKRAQESLLDARSTVDHLEKDWQTRLRDEAEQGRLLKKELELQDDTIAELQENLKLQEDSRMASERSCSTMKQRLKEKDDMLRYVEEEINRVKELYETREKSLAKERDRALEGLRDANLAKERAEAKVSEAQVQTDAISILKAEFQIKENTLISALRDKDSALAELRQKNSDLETETREKIQVIEKQRAIASTKVGELSKVLEELRDAT